MKTFNTGKQTGGSPHEKWSKGEDAAMYDYWT